MQAAIRNKTLVSVVKKDLTAMNMPENIVTAFVTAVRARYACPILFLQLSTPPVCSFMLTSYFMGSFSRFELEDAALEHATGLPTLTDLKWY